jgi:hypothetical protein
VVADIAVLLGALLAEKLLALGKREPDLLPRLGNKELLRRVDRSYKLNLRRASLLEAAENVQQDAFEHIDDFVVALLDFHLQIEAGELAKSDMRVNFRTASRP